MPDQGEEDEIRERRADEPEEDDRRDRLPAGDLARRLRDAGGQQGEGRDRGRSERHDLRARLGEMPPRQQASEPVARGHSHDGQRAEDLPLGLRADEQRDADEPDRDPDELHAGHALLVEEREREHGDEDRHRRLDDRREPGVEPRLTPGQQPERHRRVDQADDDEPAPVGAQLGARHVAAERERDDDGERERREPDPAEHERRGRHVAHGHLDEHERAAPDQRQHGEQQQVPHRGALARAAPNVVDRAHASRASGCLREVGDESSSARVTA